MLEVHPPHHPTHTWKEFFIHIATICVGLLIAIGLEQSVEAVHRHAERRELIRDMHAEAERNLQVMAPDIKVVTSYEHWTLAVLNMLTAATPANGVITVTLPSQSPALPTYQPSRTVWTVAKANGKVALLSENLAEIYSRVDYEADEYVKSHDERVKAEASEIAVETRLRIQVEPEVTLHLSTADRDELARALAVVYTTSHNTNHWLMSWAGATNGIAHDASTQDDMNAYMRQYVKAMGQ
jgi:hypothetical protein